jgi:hypothetical protein
MVQAPQARDRGREKVLGWEEAAGWALEEIVSALNAAIKVLIPVGSPAIP